MPDVMSDQVGAPTCEIVWLDHVEARRLRDTANFDLQRPMSPSNVLRLRAEMKAGRFVPGTALYFGVLPDKSMLALNGNHTLEARAGYVGDSIPLTFVYKDVHDVTEAAAYYSRLDLQKTRSRRDSLRAFDEEKMLGESTAWTAALASALQFIFQRFRISRSDNENELARIQALRSPDVRLHAMHDALSAATRYVEAVHDAVDPKIWRRAPVMAVGIEAFRYRATDAYKFFSTMSKDDGLRTGEPQKAVLKWLRDHQVSGGFYRELQAQTVRIGWNAFLSGRTLERISPRANDDFKLDGTPWVQKDFDAIRHYLPDLFIEAQNQAGEYHGDVILADPKPKRRRGRHIQHGVDARTNRAVTIFDYDPNVGQAKEGEGDAERAVEPELEPASD